MTGRREISCPFKKGRNEDSEYYWPARFTSLSDKNMKKFLLDVCQSMCGTGKWLEIANIASKKTNCAWLIWSSFYDAVTALVIKQLMSSTLISARPLTWFPHNIWVVKLEGYGFDGWTIHCITNCLDNHVQRLAVNGSISKWISIKNGVPQWLMQGTGTI